ncbi:MAG: hypothetical protein ACLFU0_04865 [Alphaproteobacteria bacterium]
MSNALQTFGFILGVITTAEQTAPPLRRRRRDGAGSTRPAPIRARGSGRFTADEGAGSPAPRSVTMTVNGISTQPAVSLAGACTGLWLRTTAVAGLAAGLAGTVATSAAVNAWARLFETHRPGDA